MTALSHLMETRALFLYIKGCVQQLIKTYHHNQYVDGTVTGLMDDQTLTIIKEF